MISKMFNVVAWGALAFHGSQILGNKILPHLNETLSGLAGQFTPAAIGAVTITAGAAVIATLSHMLSKSKSEKSAVSILETNKMNGYNSNFMKNECALLGILGGTLVMMGALLSPEHPAYINPPALYPAINMFSNIVGSIFSIGVVVDGIRNVHNWRKNKPSGTSPSMS